MTDELSWVRVVTQQKRYPRFILFYSKLEFICYIVMKAGDVFRTIVPLNGMNDNGDLNDKVDDNGILNDNLDDNADYHRILTYAKSTGAINTTQATQVIGRSRSTARRVLLRLVAAGVLVPAGANRNKEYRPKR